MDVVRFYETNFRFYSKSGFKLTTICKIFGRKGEKTIKSKRGEYRLLKFLDSKKDRIILLCKEERSNQDVVVKLCSDVKGDELVFLRLLNNSPSLLQLLDGFDLNLKSVKLRGGVISRNTRNRVQRYGLAVRVWRTLSQEL